MHFTRPINDRNYSLYLGYQVFIERVPRPWAIDHEMQLTRFP
jgi:hypothetical protein